MAKSNAQKLPASADVDAGSLFRIKPFQIVKMCKLCVSSQHLVTENHGSAEKFAVFSQESSGIRRSFYLLVHAVLQNRNFLKQNAYNEKRRFS